MALKEIIEGYGNMLFPKKELKKIIKNTSKARMLICKECPNNSKFHSTPLRPDEYCILCGCSLSPKTKCLSCKCPIDKWQAVISEEEDLKIKENEQVDN